MDPLELHYLNLTRRRFFGLAAKSVGAGLGSMAISSLLGRSASAGVLSTAGSLTPGPASLSAT